MLGADEEERLLRRAIEKGWLSVSDLSAQSRPLKGASGPVRFGARLDMLVATGVLNEEAVSELLREESVAGSAPEDSAALGVAPTMPPPDPEHSSADSAEPIPPSPLAQRFVSPVPDWDRYELLALLGQGGMGTVYKARDLRLHRFVAIKFLHAEHESAVQRFQQEARAQARIEHENVCKVYEVGAVAGRPYIAMELVGGLPLQKVMGQLRVEEKLCIVRDAAEALHAAHRLGIVHRDVKPSNILIQRRDDGTWRPVLLDFGLAHDAEADHALTRSGVVMGTPAYMSPEQARGETRNLDRRTDVYALGATLFELLSGRAPFVRENQTEVLLKVLSDEPPSLRSLSPELSADLEIIVHKCLQKDPAQRYDSARALAEDLQRYLNGEPILGRRTSFYYRLRRRARKHRAAVAIGTLALTGLVVLGLYGAQARLQVRREQVQAAARTKLAQELGQTVKEMEWFIRSVHQLAVHDTRYARAIVRGRMQKLESLRHDLGSAGDGLVQHALGHACVALQDFDCAHQHLVDAQRRGNDTPELAGALGRVLGEQYKKQLEAALRTGDSGFVKARKKELRAKYVQPAISLLRMGQGVELGSAQLLDGLIALYSEKYDDAQKRAEAASRETPWLYEPKQLAGDVHFARGIDLRNEGRLDEAKQSFERAVGQYKEATEIARSNTTLYEAIAESYLQWGDIAANLQQQLGEVALFEQAIASCQKALLIAPDRASCYSKSARAHAFVALIKTWGRKPVDDQLASITALVQKGLLLDPDDANFYDALGNIYHYAASLAKGREATLMYYALSFDNFYKALKKQANFPISIANLCFTYMDKSYYFYQTEGVILVDELRTAVRHARDANAVDPNYTPAWTNLFSIHWFLVQYMSLNNQEPGKALQEMRHDGQRAILLSAKIEEYYYTFSLAYHYYIEYLLWKQDVAAAAEALDQERSLAAQAERLLPATERQLTFARIYLAADEARVLLHRGQDPSLAIEKGRSAMGPCSSFSNVFFGECLRVESLLALMAAEHAARHGRPRLPALLQAVESARRAAKLDEIGENIELLARALLHLVEERTPRAAPALLTEALSRATEVIVEAPGRNETLALRGRLHLLQMELAKTKQERLALVRKAQDDFARAVQKNPLFARVYAAPIARAQALLTQLSPN